MSKIQPQLAEKWVEKLVESLQSGNALVKEKSETPQILKKISGYLISIPALTALFSVGNTNNLFER